MFEFLRPKKSAEFIVLVGLVDTLCPLVDSHNSSQIIELLDGSGIDAVTFRYEHALLVGCGYLMSLEAAKQSGYIDERQMNYLANLFLEKIKIAAVQPIRETPYAAVPTADVFSDLVVQRLERYVYDIDDNLDSSAVINSVALKFSRLCGAEEDYGLMRYVQLLFLVQIPGFIDTIKSNRIIFPD